mmetsp:Transcript_41263/g.74375  ORF Transcript_41263/g.74375 Transcript_41263/m.74375 type:complete len:301 (+) Transcript_41263:101-1003(+)|eukprot:CAMPEP_0201930490 /NCGR_PEP_ID=MMETSP0903-20130614/25264_1 /ASSEMBLY_ACC=CAM_ASM_000552 /TAXON_ID=420261 /ORGANISM="Thalassiosira antarctica, Strain CCMP982" /LENGTH=300 /DNA_ID=CAMNT_0048469565 /DNA_START=19 /DNA_END=921 /DNA_ORIENTATION=-
MRSPWLKEHLLDDPEVELPAVPPENAELEQAIEKWRLGRPAETLEEKTMRISNQARIDRLVIVGYGIVMAISVISCAVAMWFSSSGILELLFAMSIIQGPFSMYQRLKLIRLRSTREAISTLWNDSTSLKQSSDRRVAEIVAMQKDVEGLRSSLSRYKPMMKGYDISGVTDLYHENERINKEKKLLAEAIGLENLTRNILRTDINKDHYIGDAELSILAQRIELIEGVPFTSEEMRERFRQEERQTRSLTKLCDVVRTLYIEKRRERVVTKAEEESERSPRNLGSSLLWKRKIDGIGITV